ncbi:MAG: Npun_F5749 family FMN-dependent PPOX-type flavoprotein [Cyanobacteria bacterium J06626_23]
MAFPSDVSAAPSLTESLPLWRPPLSRALHRNRSQPQARYFQLATLGENDQPANRTVVFRGFVAPPVAAVTGHSLKFVTDGRSQKIHQMAQNPWAEACWYFAKTREQFRLSGLLHHIPSGGNPALRRASWQALSPSAQAQFGRPEPGKPQAPDTSFQATAVDADEPPETFVVVLLTPSQVDHLELRGDPQQRTQYQQVGTVWQRRAVNP